MDRTESLHLVADALASLLIDAGVQSRRTIASLPGDLHVDAVDVLANVEHFIADSDIRNSDESYRKMQETQLRTLIEELRRGASREKLMRFSFLTL